MSDKAKSMFAALQLSRAGHLPIIDRRFFKRKVRQDAARLISHGCTSPAK